MKALNKKAEAIFRACMAEMSAEGSAKIDRAGAGIMALCVERVGWARFAVAKETQHPLISFAHYYEQNGDMMRDPDVVMMDMGAGNLYPFSFRQDGGLPMDNDYLVYNDAGEITAYRTRAQADLASFCNGWALNIREQQHINPAQTALESALEKADMPQV